MFSILKKKELSLRFFTNTEFSHINEFAPIQRSSNFIPNWFKNTPKSSIKTNELDLNISEYETNLTVRSCVGIQNILTSGVVIPWWSDLQISVGSSGYRYQFADKLSIIQRHSNEQAPNFFEEYYFFNVQCPWLMTSSHPIKFMIIPYFYQDSQSDVIFMPAIGETISKNNISTLNFFLAVKKTKETVTYRFKNNTPAFQIIPITEKPYNIETKAISNEEFSKMYNVFSNKLTSTHSGLLKRKLSKCPFHNKD